MNPGFEETEKVTLLAFLEELRPVARNWYKIGKELQVSEDTLKKIRTIHYKDHTRCLGDVYTEWKMVQPNPTWEKLLEVLRSRNICPTHSRCDQHNPEEALS